MPRSPLMLALAVTAALAGCAGQTSQAPDSSGRFQGDERLVANKVEDLESAAGKRSSSNNGKICRDILTTGLARAFAAHSGTCEKGVGSALKDADAYQLSVQDVTITGSGATAKVKVETGKQDKVQSVGLVKQGGGWRISEFG